MSDIYQAAILGLIQGLTEFLPISSSAHLIVLPWLMHWRPFGLTFDVLLHIGTLGAVLAYFRREWTRVLKDVLAGRWLPEDGGRLPLGSALVLATLPVIVVGLTAADLIRDYLRTPQIVAFTLSAFGLLLLAADRSGRKSRTLDSLGWRDALLIGCAQAVALMPGVSRSGVTMTAALVLGLGRADSARFSFLMAGPAIALAGAKSVLDLLQAPQGHGFSSAAGLAGIMVAAGSGFLCISFLLRFLQGGSFLPFVLYRCGLAGVILYLLWA